MQELIIRVDEWILADGNYPYFQVGDLISFALTVDSLEELKPSSKKKGNVKHLVENTYQIDAKLVYLYETSTVLDTGDFCLFIDGLEGKYPGSKKKMKKGDYLSFKADLAIDEFVYKESMHKEEGMPPVVYEWVVKKIEFEGKVSPYIKLGEEYEIDFDKTQQVREEVFHTDLETESEKEKRVYKSAHSFLVKVQKTTKLPRFTVMSHGGKEYHLTRFRKEKADRLLYELIQENREASRETAQIAQFVEKNFKALNYNTQKQEQVKKHEQLAVDFFDRVVQEYSYHDCLITDESMVNDFMPDHSHEEILYLIKREYKVKDLKLVRHFTFVELFEQLALRLKKEPNKTILW